MSEQNVIFSSTQLGGIKIHNRVLMAPLTRNRAGEGNVPQALNVEYYRQRASAGLIITEASQVSAAGVGYPATPGIHSQEQIEGWRKVTEAVHERQGKIIIQLWYCGRISHPSMLPNQATPVSASAIRPEGEAMTYEGAQPFVVPHALEVDEIKQIIEEFRQAAHNAKAAGFDGIEVHAANGYLIDQFLRDGTNHRTDSYGGSLQNRNRFLMEVLNAVFDAWPANQVGVRLSPENSFNDIKDSNPQLTFNSIAEAIGKLDLAYVHVVEGDMADGSRTINYQEIKDHFAGNYIANCGYDQAKAEAALKQGTADAIAFGSLYIANPDLVERLKQDAPLTTPDQATFYGGDEHGYTDYPTLEQEQELALA